MSEQIPKGWDGSWLEAGAIVLLCLAGVMALGFDLLLGSKHPAGLERRPEPKL